MKKQGLKAVDIRIGYSNMIAKAQDKDGNKRVVLLKGGGIQLSERDQRFTKLFKDFSSQDDEFLDIVDILPGNDVNYSGAYFMIKPKTSHIVPEFKITAITQLKQPSEIPPEISQEQLTAMK